MEDGEGIEGEDKRMKITKKICKELKVKGFSKKALKDLCLLCLTKDKLGCENKKL